MLGLVSSKRLSGTITDPCSLRNFLTSLDVADALYSDQYSDDSQTTYWTGSYNLRGAQRRILRDKTASPTEPSVKGVTVTGISFKQS